MTHDRRWAYLPLVVTGFLLHHTDDSVRVGGSSQQRGPSFDTHGEGFNLGRRKAGKSA